MSERASSAPMRKVMRVQFGVLSPEEITAMSVAEIKYPETIEDGRAKLGGLNDPRMGTVDRDVKCQTCAGTTGECPGHFGHIELAKPVFHVGWIDKVVTVLRCVCFYCAKLKMSRSHPKMQEAIARTKDDKHRRLQACNKLCSGISECTGGSGQNENDDPFGLNFDAPKETSHSGGCGHYLPVVRRNRSQGHTLELVAEWKRVNDESQERKMAITAERALNILKNISREDCETLGFDWNQSRPDWMI